MSLPKVFLSYSRKDEDWKDRLVEHLRPYELGRRLSLWHDRDIRIGEEWRNRIEGEIREADLAVLLISQHFLGSSYIRGVELPLLHERYQTGKLKVFPLLVRQCAWDEQDPALSWFSELQRRPPDGISLEDLHASGSIDKELAEITRGLVKAVEEPEPVGAGREYPPLVQRSGFRWAVALTLLTILAVFLWEWRWSRPRVPSRPSVAVLTFTDPTGEGRFGWLATALPEALSAKLAWDDRIRVADRIEVGLQERGISGRTGLDLPSQELERLRRLLAVDHIAAGVFQPVGGTSVVRLDLVLYDARKRRVIARGRAVAEITDWLRLADRASEGQPSFREVLGAPVLSGEQRKDFEVWFPRSSEAARLWAEGLALLQRFDVRGARALFSRAVDTESNLPLLTVLARTAHSLGDEERAGEILDRARALDRDLPEGPRSLPRELLRHELRILEAERNGDTQAILAAHEALFQELLFDDPLAGVRLAEVMTDAGVPEKVPATLEDLRRRLPLARDQPAVELAEAVALRERQFYNEALAGAQRVLALAQALDAQWYEALARLEIALSLSAQGRNEKAQEELAEVRSTFQSVGDLRNLAKTIEVQSFHASETDLAQAERLLMELVDLNGRLGDTESKMAALFSWSAVLAARGRLPEARVRAAEAEDLSARLWSQDEGYPQYFRGYRLHLEGQLDRAAESYEAARKVFSQSGANEFFASTLTNLGEIKAMQGDLVAAENLHNTVADINRRMGADASLAYDTLRLGLVRATRGDAAGARERYEDAMKVVAPSGVWNRTETETFVEILMALADLDVEATKLPMAERRVREALRIAHETGFIVLESRASSSLAKVLLKERRLTEARRAAERAMELSRGSDFRAVQEARIATAWMHFHAGDLDSAWALAEKITADCAAFGYVPYKLESLLLTGAIEQRTGHVNEGRRRLEDLQRHAGALGFARLAARAAAALGT